MKKIFITFCMLVLSCATFGQQIKSKNVELNDLISLLGAAGYEIFNYDISEMLNERYDITIVQKEFLAGEEIATINRTTVSNKRLLTEFPESQWQGIIDAGRIIDPITQAISHAEKISFGFYPSGNDSTKFMQIDVPGFAASRTTFKLRGLVQKNSDKLLFFYIIRPFQIKAFKEDEFIPLILVASGWYDERFDIFRACTQREIEPEMSDEIYRNIPHHYIMGVKFVKKQ